MGRGNEKLIPFLRDALAEKKYSNLVDLKDDTFYINFSRYNKYSEPGSEQIIIDWLSLNNKEYKDYRTGKSALKSALKHSIYLVYVSKSDTKMIYRFGTEAEIQEKEQEKIESSRNRIQLRYIHSTVPYSFVFNSDDKDITFKNQDMQHEKKQQQIQNIINRSQTQNICSSGSDNSVEKVTFENQDMQLGTEFEIYDLLGVLK